MKLPWHNETGLYKAAAISATIFVISLGLCGVNAVVMTASSNSNLDGVLTMTAFAEAAGIIVGFLALIITAAAAIFQTLFFRRKPASNPDRKEK